MNVYVTWGWTLLLMFHYQHPSVNTTIFLSRTVPKLLAPCAMFLYVVRTCPDAMRIQEYPHDSGYDVEIPEGSKVYFTCYKSHLQVLKVNNPVSTNVDLSVIISDLKKIYNRSQ